MFYGTESCYWYLVQLARRDKLMLLLAATGIKKNRFLGLIASTILVSHCIVSHKENRFIYPLLPILVTLAALGLVEVIEFLNHWLRMPSIVLTITGASILVLLSAFLVPQFSFWRDANTMIMFNHLSKDQSICGVGIHSISWVNTGGYTYLLRKVPVIVVQDDIASDRIGTSFNAFLTSTTDFSLLRLVVFIADAIFPY
jgi:GPI mannosyltransferase 3